MIREFLEAAKFLTAIPLPSARHSAKRLAKGALFFPVIGLLIGVLSVGLYLLLKPFVITPVADFILLAMPILLSGGLHLDGLADTCDGFFGGRTREDVLRIMKDSRLGVWGVAGVVGLLLLKFELLQALPSKLPVFVLALVLSRWAQVVLCYFMSYAGNGGGLADSVVGHIGIRELVGASFFMCLGVIVLSWPGFLCLLAVIILLGVLGFLYQQRIGGTTGDTVGAASELIEVLTFLVVTSIYR
ncbi:MAG: adenosylcobinamide-GDP ribazoletransferase [Candidatus Omnitrophota bacterium]|nr:adenosylcobinamide-GDP ribazoletransferase [Candidatus Omnitrophota bacterium]